MFNSKKENNVMKKTYIEPSVKAIEIKLSHLMITSDPVTETKFDPSESTNTMDGFDAEFSEENEY